MPVVTIELSDSQLSSAQKRASIFGFADVDEYLREVVADEIGDPSTSVEFPPKGFPTKAEIEKMLLEAMEGPSRELGPDDFAKQREEWIRLYASRKASDE